MKNLLFMTLAVVMIVTMTGCVPTGQSASVAQSQMPPPPTDMPPLPKDWQKKFESGQSVRMKFIDPDSAQFTYVGQPTLCQFGMKGSNSYLPGYCGYALVNAKNSFGGYAGNQAAAYYFMTINNEKTGHKTRVVMPILAIGESEVSRVITNPDLRNR